MDSMILQEQFLVCFLAEIIAYPVQLDVHFLGDFV